MNLCLSNIIRLHRTGVSRLTFTTFSIELNHAQLIKRQLSIDNINRSVNRLHKNLEHCQVLIVGGGTGGCTLAAKLSRKLGAGKVIVVEPSKIHYYQPMFTLIGGGMKRLEQARASMSDVLPKKTKWIQDKVMHFDPMHNLVTTLKGTNISYDVLILAAGLHLYYVKILGLIEALKMPKSKVCSIYSPQYVENTWECLRRIESGQALFTYPASPVKCPGAPQKIMYIAEHYFRKLNKRNSIDISYYSSLPVLFSVQRYADALWKVVKERNININLNCNLVEVHPDKNIAVFEKLDKSGERFEREYSMLHVVPPMGTPSEIKNCKDLTNEAGFIDVNKSTMQHTKFANIFAIGDCASSPNSKTAASIAAQSTIVSENVLTFLKGKNLDKMYNGYASCPLVTGYNSCILAEFDYDLKPTETFPIPQNKERYSMFLLKKELMPVLYWKFLLNGYWNGPATLRKGLSLLNPNEK